MKMKSIISFMVAGLAFFSANLHAFTPLTGPLTTENGQIINSKTKQPIAFQGVNWFGFNTSNHILHGLWTADFARMLKQMKDLGFNAVRLPIQFDFVLNPSIKPTGINTSCNGPNSCNRDIPTDSALQALTWVVQELTKNGIYVLLDDHYEDHMYRDSPSDWIRGWETVAQLFKDNNMVGYDIYNEPDSHQITWDGRDSNAPAWGDSILLASDAIYAIDKNKLIFVEGTAQGRLESNWGNGFATDDEVVASNVSNPKIFFTQLMSKPYLNQIIISPHVYGPDGTNGDGTDESNPEHAYKIWSRLFGYLKNNYQHINHTDLSGFCLTHSNCHVFAVAVGEFGGKFDAKDPWYEQDTATNINLANYLNSLVNKNETVGPNWFYWDWNPNSGNTGGILKDDWKTIDCNKVKYLVKNLHLKTSDAICRN